MNCPKVAKNYWNSGAERWVRVAILRSYCLKGEEYYYRLGHPERRPREPAVGPWNYPSGEEHSNHLAIPERRQVGVARKGCYPVEAVCWNLRARKEA